MNRIEHRNFAVSVLGVPASFYDELNARNDAHNKAIRDARSEYFDAFNAGDAALIKSTGDALSTLVSI